MLENVFMEDVMVISITHHLSRPSGSAQVPRIPTPDPSFLVGCAHEAEPSVLAFVDTKHTADLSIFYSTATRSFVFAGLSIYGLGSKVARFTADNAWGAVVMPDALSRHLCFLRLLAWFAVRLTTMATHPFKSIN